MELAIYIADSRALTEPQLFKAYYEKLPEGRRLKVDGVRAPGKRAESLGAGILLEYALNEAGLAGSDRTITYLPSGKPVLKDCGISLSHSNGIVMCAIAPFELGCDIERIGKKDYKKLSERFFHDYEKAYASSSEEAFTRLWTLKEAYVKYLGTGLSKSLDSFFFEGLSGSDELKVIDNQKRNDSCFIYTEKLGNEYIYSVCASASEAHVVKILDFAEDILCTR